MFKIILILILSTPSHPFSDRALFKVQEKIYWGTQVNQFLATIQTYYCLNPQSPYFKIIKFIPNEKNAILFPKDYKQIFDENSTQFPVSFWAPILILAIKLQNYLATLPAPISSSSNKYLLSPCLSSSNVPKTDLALLEKLEEFVSTKYPNNEASMLRFFKILLGQQGHEFIFSLQSPSGPLVPNKSVETP